MVKKLCQKLRTKSSEHFMAKKKQTNKNQKLSMNTDSSRDEHVEDLAASVGDKFQEMLSSSNNNLDGSEDEDSEDEDSEDEDSEEDIESSLQLVVDRTGSQSTSSPAQIHINSSMSINSSEDENVEDLAASVGDELQEMLSSSSCNLDGSEDEDSEDDIESSLQLVVDRTGSQSTSSPAQIHTQQLAASDESDSSEDEENSDDEANLKHDTTKNSIMSMELSSSLQPAMDADKMIYLNTDIYGKPQLSNKNITELMLNGQGKGSELLKKSVLTPDLEKQTEIKPYHESVRHIKKQRQLERQKTKGGNWYDMRAPEMTDEKKNDLMVIQMRRSLNPKRFYKAPDTKALPKYFQMGTIIEDSTDFYHSRIPKKQRKQTIVDELLADSEFRKYNKRKYSEIQEAKMKKSRGAFKHSKRMKKRKK